MKENNKLDDTMLGEVSGGVSESTNSLTRTVCPSCLRAINVKNENDYTCPRCRATIKRGTVYKSAQR